MELEQVKSLSPQLPNSQRRQTVVVFSGVNVCSCVSVKKDAENTDLYSCNHFCVDFDKCVG